MEKLDARSEDLTFDIQHVNLFYGKNQALKDISMQVRKNEITALIGPSGCGKSTLLKTLNRMNILLRAAALRIHQVLKGLISLRKSIPCSCVIGWGWSFSSLRRFLRVYMIMLLMGRASRALRVSPS